MHHQYAIPRACDGTWHSASLMKRRPSSDRADQSRETLIEADGRPASDSSAKEELPLLRGMGKPLAGRQEDWRCGEDQQTRLVFVAQCNCSIVLVVVGMLARLWLVPAEQASWSRSSAASCFDQTDAAVLRSDSKPPIPKFLVVDQVAEARHPLAEAVMGVTAPWVPDDSGSRSP
jgi:hypothetical protein